MARAVQGYSPDQAALIKVKRAIPNWNLYQQRSTCFGWVEQPVDTVCQWTSVKCNAGGRVTMLHFQTNASFHLGAHTLCFIALSPSNAHGGFHILGCSAYMPCISAPSAWGHVSV